jgi:hypothetical protein
MHHKFVDEEEVGDKRDVEIISYSLCHLYNFYFQETISS